MKGMDSNIYIQTLEKPKISQDDIQAAIEGKRFPVAALINTMYQKSIQQLESDANDILKALETALKEESERHNILQHVNNQKGSSLNALQAKDKMYQEKIKKQTQTLQTLEKETKVNTSSATSSVSTSSSSMPPAPPPPPPMNTTVRSTKPLQIPKKGGTQKKIPDVSSKPSFDLSAITAGLNSLRPTNTAKPNTKSNTVSSENFLQQNKMNRNEQIKTARSDGEKKLSASYEKFSKLIDEKQKQLSKIKEEVNKLTAEIIDRELTDLEPILEELVTLEEQISSNLSKKIKHLETKKQLLTEIEAAKAVLPLPPPFEVAEVSVNAAPPPPPPPPSTTTMTSTQKNPHSSNTATTSSTQEEQVRPNIASDLNSSPQFLKLQKQTRERELKEQEEQKRIADKENSEKERILRERIEKADRLIAEQKKNSSASPESIALLENYQQRLDEAKKQLNELSNTIDNQEELKQLMQQRDHAQQAQQEDYNERLAQRDNKEYVPPSSSISEEFNNKVSNQEETEQLVQQRDHAQQALQEDYNERLAQKDNKANVQQADTSIPLKPNQQPIPEDKKTLVSEFIKNYKTHFWSNKNRKLQLEEIKVAFDKNDLNNMDTVIEKIRSEIFEDNQNDRRRANETRWLGKSAMEKFVKAYIELDTKQNKSRPKL